MASPEQLRAALPAAALRVKLRQQHEEAATRFVRRYWTWPAGFVKECLTWPTPTVDRPADGPTYYQEEILREIPNYHRFSCRGPHGLGKTALMSWLVHWFALTRDRCPYHEGGCDWKVVTTASVWRQLDRYLWPEIKKWGRRIKWDMVGRDPYDERFEFATLGLALKRGQAFPVASNDSQKIEGAHADHILYILDEAKIIPAGTWEAVEGALSTEGSTAAAEIFVVAFSTPGEPNGVFHDIHKHKPGYSDWKTRHVTLEEAIGAGRVSRSWADQRKLQWGEHSAAYQNRVLGEFATSDEDATIPLRWIEAANDRWAALETEGLLKVEEGGLGLEVGTRRVHVSEKLGPLTHIGVDVAYTGGDKTVRALRYGNVLAELRVTALEDTMQTTGRIIGDLHRSRKAQVVCDVIGVGAGVVDRLREQKYKVDAFNASHASKKHDISGELGFINRRAEAWWSFRESLDPTYDSQIALPEDDELLGDLTSPRWKVTSTGRIQIESKDDIKERIGRSPDKGDAVVQAFGARAPRFIEGVRPQGTEKVSVWRNAGSVT